MKAKLLLFITMLAVASFLGIPIASAFDHNFSGKIVFVDPKLRAFTVQGKTEEKTFVASAHSQFTIDSEPRVFGELKKGDEVSVRYQATTQKPIVKYVSESKLPESNTMQFEGVITAIDMKANNLTVKGDSGQMVFHVDPSTRLYIGAEFKFLGELNNGEHVRVTYRTEGEKQMVLHVARNQRTR